MGGIIDGIVKDGVAVGDDLDVKLRGIVLKMYCVRFSKLGGLESQDTWLIGETDMIPEEAPH